MIANLITTILLALGVATGNVSSNVYKGGNAFNNANKIDIEDNLKSKNAIVSINDELTPYYITDIETTRGHIYKWYFGLSNDNLSPTYSTAYYNLYHTSYTYPIRKTLKNHWYNVSIYKFTPYYNYSNNEFKIEELAGVLQSASTTYTYNYVNFELDNRIEQYIDLTTTTNTPSEVDALVTLGLAEGTNIQQGTIDTDTGYGYDNQNYTNTYSLQVNPQENESKYFVMCCYVVAATSSTVNTISSVQPYKMIIKGNVTLPDYNYEVVDIPNLMFTILTLPFSWYSTAFNLTIFPNTPYSLNFGNLVLTILAAMILLYLIRKVIK